MLGPRGFSRVGSVTLDPDSNRKVAVTGLLCKLLFANSQGGPPVTGRPHIGSVRPRVGLLSGYDSLRMSGRAKLSRMRVWGFAVGGSRIGFGLLQFFACDCQFAGEADGSSPEILRHRYLENGGALRPIGGSPLRKPRYSDEQIAAALRQAEAGASIAETTR